MHAQYEAVCVSCSWDDWLVASTIFCLCRKQSVSATLCCCWATTSQTTTGVACLTNIILFALCHDQRTLCVYLHKCMRITMNVCIFKGVWDIVWDIQLVLVPACHCMYVYNWSVYLDGWSMPLVCPVIMLCITIWGHYCMYTTSWGGGHAHACMGGTLVCPASPNCLLQFMTAILWLIQWIITAPSEITK